MRGTMAAARGMSSAAATTSAAVKVPKEQWKVDVTDSAAKVRTPNHGRSLLKPPRCTQQLKVIRERDRNPDLKLRVYVKGGGCSGFEYKLELTTDVEPEDR